MEVIAQGFYPTRILATQCQESGCSSSYDVLVESRYSRTVYDWRKKELVKIPLRASPPCWRQDRLNVGELNELADRLGVKVEYVEKLPVLLG